MSSTHRKRNGKLRMLFALSQFVISCFVCSDTTEKENIVAALIKAFFEEVRYFLLFDMGHGLSFHIFHLRVSIHKPGIWSFGRRPQSDNERDRGSHALFWTWRIFEHVFERFVLLACLFFLYFFMTIDGSFNNSP